MLDPISHKHPQLQAIESLLELCFNRTTEQYELLPKKKAAAWNGMFFYTMWVQITVITIHSYIIRTTMKKYKIAPTTTTRTTQSTYTNDTKIEY